VYIQNDCSYMVAHIIRARNGFVVLVINAALLLSGLFIYLYIKDAIGIAGCIILISIFCYLALSVLCYRVLLNHDSVLLRTNCFKYDKVMYADIQRVSLCVGFVKGASSVSGFQRLEIYSDFGVKEPAISINLKLISYKNLLTIRDAIVSNINESKIDKELFLCSSNNYLANKSFIFIKKKALSFFLYFIVLGIAIAAYKLLL